MSTRATKSMTNVSKSPTSKPKGAPLDKMDPRKQATLMNYHQALEDRVDLERIWPELEEIFTPQEKREIKHAKGKEQMRLFVDIITGKDDAAFGALVKALRRDYRSLASRLVQGVKEEDMRLKQAGEGVRQKVALALLTTRISERQKETIIANVSDVIDSELHDKSLRVTIPDHRASAELEHINAKLKQIIHDEVDPLLYGTGHKTDLSNNEAEDVAARLQNMLVELNIIQDCYSTLGVHAYSNSGKSLPNILCQKIEETKTSINILQKEKKELAKEKADLTREKNLQGKDVGTLESRNRSLELHNRNLEAECGKLDEAVKKLTAIKDSLEIEKRKLQTDNQRLTTTSQGLESEAWNLGIKYRKVEELNQKLSRENQKLSSKSHLSKRDSIVPQTVLKGENKNLQEEKARLKTEMGKLEGDKRQLLIRNQKLESENENLRDQKRKLMTDKRKYWGENQQLKTEAKRLALGNAQPSLLPPISEVQGSKASLKSSGQPSDQGAEKGNTRSNLSQSHSRNPSYQSSRTSAGNTSFQPSTAGQTTGTFGTSSRGLGKQQHGTIRARTYNTSRIHLNRNSVNNSTFTMSGNEARRGANANAGTGKQPSQSKYRVSVYDYRPKDKAVQFDAPRPRRYGNRA